MDDMELVENVNDIKEYPANTFYILTKQLNDHRLVFSRIGILLAYILRGTIDFKTSAILGFFNLILLGFSFFLVYKSKNKGNLAFIPIVFLLLSANIFLAHLWGLLAFENTLAVAFSILCLYFLQPGKEKYWLFAFPFAIFSTLTNLEAVTVIPIGICWLFFQGRWKQAVYFLLASAVYMFIFFLDFRFSAASKFPLTFESLLLIVKSLAVAVGSQAKTISDTHGILLSLIFGSVILIIFFGIKMLGIIGVIRGGNGKTGLEIDFTDVCFLKILAALLMVAVGRHAEGIDNMVALRFQIYSVSMLIIFYLFLLKTLQNKRLYFFKIGAVFSAVLLFGLGYKKYSADINYAQAGLQADSYNYSHYHLYLHQYFNMPEPEPAFYRNFIFPDIFDQKTINAWKNRSGASPNTVSSMSLHEVAHGERNRDEMYEFLKLEVVTPAAAVLPADVYLGLRHDNAPEIFYLIAFKKGNSNWSNEILGRNAGRMFSCDLPGKIPKGIYNAKMCWIEDGVAKSISLPKKIRM